MTASHTDLLARLNADLPPTGILLGAEILELDPSGRVRMSFVATPEFCNPNGTVQGGIVAAMLDDAAEMACVADAGKRIFVATIEMKVSFLLPAKAGKLYAEGRVIKRGRMIAFLEADLIRWRRPAPCAYDLHRCAARILNNLRGSE